MRFERSAFGRYARIARADDDRRRSGHRTCTSVYLCSSFSLRFETMVVEQLRVIAVTL